MKQLGLLCLLSVGMFSLGDIRVAGAQALPPGQEEEAEAPKRPPFYGLSLDISAWDSSGLWAGGGAYRNDLGFLINPAWSVGKTLIGHGPFRGLTLSARFLFEVPLAGVSPEDYTGEAPTADTQQPCALGQAVDTSVRPTNLPRCDWGRGSRRVDYSDLSLILSSPHVYTIPRVGVHFDPALILTLPTSVESRFQTLILQGTAQIGAGREFWKDRIGVGYTFGFGLPWYAYSTASIETQPSTTLQGPVSQDVLATGLSNFYSDPGRATVLCLGGPCRNPQLFVQHTIRGTVNFLKNLNLTVIYRISSTRFQNPTGCAEVVDGTGAPIMVCPQKSPIPLPDANWLDAQLFWAALSYQALPWLGVNLSYITACPMWQYPTVDPNNLYGTAAVGNGQPQRSYRPCILSYDANAFTSVSLGVSVTVDALAQRFLRGRP